MAGLIWGEVAVADVDRIAEFVALDDPVAATNLVNGVIDLVESLAKFPEMGQFIPKIAESRYRELIVAPTRIIYRRTDDVIPIIRVIRYEQKYDIASMLLI